jgi:hypothetical protein
MANGTIPSHRETNIDAVVLSQTLRELAGFLLAVDCGQPGCPRDRAYDLSNLAGFYGCSMTVGEVIRRLRCRECGGRADKVTLKSNPALRGRERTLDLML